MFSRKPSKDEKSASGSPRARKDSGGEVKVNTSISATGEEKERKRSRSNSIKSMLGFGKPQSEFVSDTDGEKDFVKHLPPLSRYAATGDLNKFKEALSKRKIDYTAVDNVFERNVCHWCALQNNAEFITILCNELRSKDDFKHVLNLGDSEGKTPLILAVTNHNVDVLRILLNEALSSINSPDKYGNTPLYYAAMGNDIASTTILILRGANINSVNQRGETLLMEVILSGKEEIANVIVGYNPNLNVKDGRKRTALHYSVLAKSLKLTKILLQKGTAITDKDVDGKTPLILAEETARELLTKQTEQDDLQTVKQIISLLKDSEKINEQLIKGMSESDTSISSSIFPTEDKMDTSNYKLTEQSRIQTPQEAHNLNGPEIYLTKSMSKSNENVLDSSNANIHQGSSTMPRLLVPSSRGNHMSSSRSFQDLSEDDFKSPSLTVINPLSRRQSIVTSEHTLSEVANVYAKKEEISIKESTSSSLLARSQTKDSGDELFGSRESNIDAKAINDQVDYFPSKLSAKLKEILSKQGFISSEENDTDLIDRIEKSLAKANSVIDENDILRAQLRDKSQELDVLGQQISEHRSQLDKLNANLAKKDLIIANLNEKAIDSKSAIKASELSEYQNKISQLMDQIRDKEMSILELEGNLDEAIQERQRLAEEHSKAVRHANDYKTQIDRMTQLIDADMHQYKKQLLHKDEEITRLQTKIFELQAEIEELSLNSNKPSSAKAEKLKQAIQSKEKVYLEKNGLIFSNRDTEEFASEVAPNVTLTPIDEVQFQSEEQLFEELQSELESLKTKLRSETAVLKRTKEELQSVKSQKDMFLDKIDLLTAEIKVLQKNCVESERMTKQMQSRIQAEMEARQQLEASLADETRQKHQYLDKIKILEKALNDLKEDYSKVIHISQASNQHSINEEIKALKAEKFLLEAKLKSKIDECNAINNNLSSDQLVQDLSVQLERERTARNAIEYTLKLTKATLVEISQNIRDVNLAYEHDHVEKTKEIEQRHGLDELLLQADVFTLSTNTKVETMLQHLMAARNKIFELEASLKVRDNELLTTNGLLLNEKESNQVLSKDNVMIRSKLMECEKQILDLKSKERDEVKQLQKLLKEKSLEMDQKDQLINKQANEFSSWKQEKDLLIQKLKSDYEKESKDIVKEREKAVKDYSDLNFELEDHRQKRVEAEDELKSCKKQLTILETRVEELSQRLTEKITENEIFKATINEQDGVKPDLEKAKDGIQKLQSKIAKLNGELNEKKKELEATKKRNIDLEKEKEVLYSESVKLTTIVEDTKKARLELEENASTSIKFLEDLVFNYQDHIPIDRTLDVKGSIGLDGYLDSLETVWNKYDESALLFKNVRGLWLEWAERIKNDCVISSTMSRLIVLLANHLDRSMSKSLSQISSTYSREFNKIVTDIRLAIKKLENSKDALEIQIHGNFREQLLLAETNNQTLASQILQLKQAAKVAEEHENKVVQNHEMEIRKLNDQNALLNEIVADREKVIIHLQHEVDKIEEAKKSMQKVEEKNDKLSAENKVLMQEVGYLKKELLDRDPDFESELDGHLGDHLVKLNRCANDIVQDKNIKVVGQKTLKPNVLKTLTTQMSILEKQFSESQESWNKAKRASEENYSKERMELLNEFKNHKSILDKLEQAFLRFVADTKNRSKGAMLQTLDFLIEKLNSLQEEREQLENVRKIYEATLIHNYEKQIQELLHDIDIIKYQVIVVSNYAGLSKKIRTK